jgi:hypothetical protein
MKLQVATIPALLLGCALAVPAQDVVPAGTNVTVRTTDAINIRDTSDGRIYTGVVDQDVLDRDGRVAIPRGANAELIVRNVGRDDLALDLESVTVNGRRYIVSTTDQSYAGTGKDGIGKNQRTGKYVGGGALLGTIIGAIAGGGKGAAIGAIAGGAAGAGAQTMTRGRSVQVPSESLLTFRLDRPLEVGRGEYSRDNGYDRNGYHYHNNDYQRQYNNNDNRYRY